MCLCAGHAAISEASDFELTGLVELGGLRVACFKSGDGTTFLLHPGESAYGVTLTDFDVQGGKAALKQGTNQLHVRLIQPAGFTVPQSNSKPAPLWSSAELSRREFSDVSQFTMRDSVTNSISDQKPQAAWPTAAPRTSGPSIQSRPVSGPSVSAPLSASSPIASPTTGAAVSGQEAPVSMAMQPSGSSDVIPGAQDTSTVPASAFWSNPAQNALWHEGERIRALYGEGALLAWGRDQYLKSQGRGH